MILVVVGIGCHRNTSRATLEAALADALAATWRVRALATVARKAEEPALRELAARQSWPLHRYDLASLWEMTLRLPVATTQPLAHPRVAEAAALLAAGAPPADLLLPRRIYRGADGKHVTVAAARWRGRCPVAPPRREV